MDRWLVVADGRPTVIVPGNRKHVITLRIEWKIVRRRSTASACIPECVRRPAFAAFQPYPRTTEGAFSRFHVYEVVKIICYS